MAIISCPECGKQISDRAVACPDCGCPINAAPVAAAPIDNAKEIANMLKLAENAVEQGNNSQAEDYANKVLELDSENAFAWLIKGEAVGWQSTLNNVRFSEMASCFSYALENAPEDKVDAYKKIMASQATALSKAFLSLTTGNFEKYPSEDNVKNVRMALSSYISLGLDLMKLFVFMDRDSISDYISLKLNDAAVAGFNKAKDDFGPENSDRTKYAWDLWRTRCANCLDILELALAECDNIARINTINKNYKVIIESVNESCSFKFEANGYWSGYVKEYSLTNESIKSNQRMINEFSSRASRKISKIEENARKKKEEEQKKKNEKYWNEHAEERAELETQKNELEAKIQPINKELNELEVQLKKAQEKRKIPVAAIAEQETLRKQIDSLVEQKKALGIFKGKEKKALQAQIDELEVQVSIISQKVRQQEKERDDSVSAETAPISAKVTSLSDEKRTLQKEIDKIENELTKNR